MGFEGCATRGVDRRHGDTGTQFGAQLLDLLKQVGLAFKGFTAEGD